MGISQFKLSQLALALSATIVLSACGDNDKNVDVIPDKPTVEVPDVTEKPAVTGFVAANIVNSVSGNVVDGATVRFLENGVLSTNIVDVEGNAISDAITAAQGAFSFKVADNSEIKAIDVLVSAPGYLAKTVVVDVANLTDIHNTLISLVELNSATVAVAEKTGEAAGGKLTEALEASADSDKGGAAVAISTEVELQDADGNPIEGGEVKVALATADLDAEEGKLSAADLIPEGLNSNSTDSVKTPAAFVNVEMNAGDVEIEKFGAPITITTNMPASYVKADGTPIAAGDEFALSSFDEDTGVWTDEESVVTVGEKTGNVFPASFQISHLTGFAVVENKPSCGSAVSYNLTGAEVPASGLFLQVNGRAVTFNANVTSAQGNIIEQADVITRGISDTETANVQVIDGNGTVWGSATGVNVCGAINVALEAPAQPVSEELNLTFNCANVQSGSDQTFPLSGALVTYSLPGKPAFVASASSGTYALSGLVDGQSYTVNVVPTGGEIAPFSLSILADGTAESNNVANNNCETKTEVVTGS